MPNRTTLTEVPRLEESEEIGKVSFHIRGKLYEIEEAEAGAYEDAVRGALNEDDNTVDTAIQMKLLALACVKVDGKELDADAWAREKYPVVNRVNNELKKLHWYELETDEESSERQKAEAAAAAEAEKAKPKRKSDIPNS